MEISFFLSLAVSLSLAPSFRRLQSARLSILACNKSKCNGTKTCNYVNGHNNNTLTNSIHDRLAEVSFVCCCCSCFFCVPFVPSSFLIAGYSIWNCLFRSDKIIQFWHENVAVNMFECAMRAIRLLFVTFRSLFGEIKRAVSSLIVLQSRNIKIAHKLESLLNEILNFFLHTVFRQFIYSS